MRRCRVRVPGIPLEATRGRGHAQAPVGHVDLRGPPPTGRAGISPAPRRSMAVLAQRVSAPGCEPGEQGSSPWDRPYGEVAERQSRLAVNQVVVTTFRGSSPRLPTCGVWRSGNAPDCKPGPAGFDSRNPVCCLCGGTVDASGSNPLAPRGRGSANLSTGTSLPRWRNLVDAPVSETGVLRREGSSPSLGTSLVKHQWRCS